MLLFMGAAHHTELSSVALTILNTLV